MNDAFGYEIRSERGDAYRIPVHAADRSTNSIINHAPNGEGPSGIRVTAVHSGVLIVGGNWNNAANAGLSAWNSNNDLSNSNTNIGARLAYPSDRREIINITLGKDPASWQKKTEQKETPAGRWASRYAQPNVGAEDDRSARGVCL